MNFKKARALCAAMPGTVQDIKWGADLVFSVGTKMFACTGAEDSTTMSFKVDDERFLELTDRPGIIPAPYLARHKWVQVTVGALSEAELAALLERSYQLVFAGLTKKLQREILAA